jgi:hypothetical protein
MTWGFAASFGGVAVAVALLWLLEQFLLRGTPRNESGPEDASLDLAAALERAKAAARQVEEEIVRAESLASHR